VGDKQSRRLKLIVAYDGTGLAGWQSQTKKNTIQDQIEAALAQVTGHATRVHGAGRTDAGVHALGQCAHADVITRLKPATLLTALNATLPPQIRVLKSRFISDAFHARFSANGKVYRYRIATTPVLSPFEINRAWHLHSALDETLLRECAKTFRGRHNFAAFAANRGTPVESSVRTLRRIELRHNAVVTIVEFEGDGFLYKMVRLLVGAMIRCALGKVSLGEIQQQLVEGTPGRQRLLAPACGLTLLRVLYPKKF
jgi:tRNA pseudouridine38-40 synthase